MASAQNSRQANFALAIFLVAYVLSFVDRQILSLMVDPIRRDLGVSDLQMGLLQGVAFSLLYAFLGVPLGLLADRTSRKRIIAAGVLFWSAATALCGAASNYALLFAARMGVGVGEASLSPAAHSFLSDAFPPAKLARAMAIYSMGITLGSGLAYLIGGTVMAAVSGAELISVPLMGAIRPWQAAFFIVAIPGVVVSALVMLVREPSRKLADSGDQGTARAGLWKVLRYLAIHNRAFVAIYVSSCSLAILGYTVASWYPTLLMRNHGLNPGSAGLYVGSILLLLGSAGAVLGGFTSEFLARRGRRSANLIVVGAVSLAIPIPAIVAALSQDLTTALVGFSVYTLFFNGYFGASTAAIQLATPNRMRATNAALFLLCNSLIGLSIGASAAPLINQLFFGASEDLGRPMAVIAALAAPVAASLCWFGAKPYRQLLERGDDE